jgi:CheY-like chemotaxis protein
VANDPKRILWLDNDTPYIRPYAKALESAGHHVDVVASLSQAEKLLEKEYDLIIIDVMVPTQNDDEVELYPFLETDFGHKTGLVFYKRTREKLGDKLPKVAVMTVRLDQDIKDEFVKSGLNNDNFLTKYSVREVPDFLKKIESILTS